MSNLRNSVTVDVASLDGVWNLETNESLSNGANVKADCLAGHAVATEDSLGQVVRVAPDGVVDVLVVQAVEETLLCNVVHRVSQVSQSRCSVESNIQLRCHSRRLARCVHITQGNHRSLSAEERSDHCSVIQNIVDRGADILETLRKGGHIGRTVSGGIGSTEPKCDSVEDVQDLIGPTAIFEDSEDVPAIHQAALQGACFLDANGGCKEQYKQFVCFHFNFYKIIITSKFNSNY